MSSTEVYPPSGPRPGLDRASWFSRAEGWLDDKGKGAWIAAMIVGFVIFWPIGLVFLAYMIWSKRMFSKSRNCGMSRSDHHQSFNAARSAMRPSGNSAFDAYKAETLRRLQDEQASFEEFLIRLRDAKDKAEFDQFMEDRARKARTSEPDAGNTAAA
ncbi:MAG: DUF2852 domain-containing protein [Rhodobacterales bacterium]|nr:DUF2852 domain-containing protein [Rhodobacterales bacterium]